MSSSLTRGLAILDLLVADQRAWRLNEIAQALNLSKSGLHGLLATLVECGYVEHLQGGFYQLGLKAWKVGNAFPTADLVRVAGPVMEMLVAETGEGVILGVLNGSDVSYAHLVESNQVVRVHAHVGDRIPAHCTSTGLVLLAFQEERLLDRLVPGNLEPSSGLTITNRDELMAELQATRLRGYSINRGGWHDDVGGIAAPVMGARGPVAALCIALPLFRMTPEWIKRIAPILKDRAASIEQELGLITSSPREKLQ